MISNRPDIIRLSRAAGQNPPGLLKQVDRLGSRQPTGARSVGKRRDVATRGGRGQGGPDWTRGGCRATATSASHHLPQGATDVGLMQFATLHQHPAQLLEDPETQPDLLFGA
ncbi:MAG: hypothetical protein ACKO3P_10355, partial [Planctomycetaceae bacterium]